MSSTVSEQDRARYKEAFAQFDKNHDGYISHGEIRDVLKFLKQDMTTSQSKLMLSRIDTNKDGRISFEEFVTVMQAYEQQEADKPKRSDDERLRAEFRIFDINGDGFISKAELKKVMSKLGEQLTDKEVEDMIKAADKNGDGQVNYEEFLTMMPKS